MPQCPSPHLRELFLARDKKVFYTTDDFPLSGRNRKAPWENRYGVRQYPCSLTASFFSSHCGCAGARREISDPAAPAGVRFCPVVFRQCRRDLCRLASSQERGSHGLQHGRLGCTLRHLPGGGPPGPGGDNNIPARRKCGVVSITQSPRPRPPFFLFFYLTLFAFHGILLTRSAVIPFHTWLPGAHSAAPYPVSTLLSGLVIKAPVLAL